MDRQSAELTFNRLHKLLDFPINPRKPNPTHNRIELIIQLCQGLREISSQLRPQQNILCVD